MANGLGSDIAALVSKNEQVILPEWMELQKKAGTLHTGRISEGELLSSLSLSEQKTLKLLLNKLLQAKNGKSGSLEE